MPADTKSKMYNTWASDWYLIETVLAGERAIKRAGELYLPKLSGQSKVEYDSYCQRGTFFNATSRTVQGLTGAIIRKEANIEVSANMTERLEHITVEDESIHEVVRKCLEAIVSYGYYGMLVDLPDEVVGDVNPYIACYKCTDILNNRVKIVNGEEKLIMITLAEQIETPDPDDQFATVSKDIIRCCFIGEDGRYHQQLWEKESADKWVPMGEEITPVIKGKSLDTIPFVFVNATSNGSVPSKPPILDLARINIKHWQVIVDYFHGLHFCALPTPWAAGFAIKDKLFIGSQKAWVSDDPQAKCGYLEFSGAGLSAVERALDRLENIMAVMGARFLEEQKKAAEAAETHRLRQSGDTATLATIVMSVERAIEKIITFIGEWTGDSQKPEVSINKEFVSEKLTPEEITALLQAVQMGRISMDTFLYNLQAGEILPPNRTIEEEKDLIEAEAPPPITPVTPGQPGQPGQQNNQQPPNNQNPGNNEEE